MCFFVNSAVFWLISRDFLLALSLCMTKSIFSVLNVKWNITLPIISFRILEVVTPIDFIDAISVHQTFKFTITNANIPKTFG